MIRDKQPTGGEDGAPDRPGTSMSISSQNEMGSESMMSFFRSHMTGILQPFAENVEELHKTAISMTDSLRENRCRTDANTSTLTEQAARMEARDADLDQLLTQMSNQASSTQKLLERTVREKVELESNVKSTQQLAKQALDKIETYMAQIQPRLDKLKSDLEATHGQLVQFHDTEKKNQNEIARSNAAIHSLKCELSALDKAHQRTVETVSSNKLAFDIQMCESEALMLEQKEVRTKLEKSHEYNESKFRGLDEKGAEVHRQMLQSRQEASQAHDAAMQLLRGRLDASDNVLQEARVKLNRIDVCLADQKSRTVEHGEHVNKLIKMAEDRHANDFHEARRSVDNVNTDISRHSRLIKDLQHVIFEKPDGEGNNRVQVLREDVEYAFRRALRLEKLVGLEPLAKDGKDGEDGVVLRGGIILTEAQINDFRRTFSGFDADGSGKICMSEIGEVLKGLGHDVSEDVVRLILKGTGTADADDNGDGEIDFDEFCGLMAKMLGPDGKVDVDRFLSQITENATREAKQNEAVALVPVMREQIRHLEEEQQKHGTAFRRLQNLEGDQSELSNEVRKLRKGLDLNQEYWKGFSLGLKETKKTVRQEGEGELLPSATRLRNLPPLDARPATHAGNTSARTGV